MGIAPQNMSVIKTFNYSYIWAKMLVFIGLQAA